MVFVVFGMCHKRLVVTCFIGKQTTLHRHGLTVDTQKYPAHTDGRDEDGGERNARVAANYAHQRDTRMHTHRQGKLQ